MRVLFAEQARDEVRSARGWYRKRNGLAARRFIVEVSNAVAALASTPQVAPEIEAGIRRLLLDKFPYALLYSIEPDHILVLAVAHLKRHPEYWRRQFCCPTRIILAWCVGMGVSVERVRPLATLRSSFDLDGGSPRDHGQACDEDSWLPRWAAHRCGVVRLRRARHRVARRRVVRQSALRCLRQPVAELLRVLVANACPNDIGSG